MASADALLLRVDQIRMAAKHASHIVTHTTSRRPNTLAKRRGARRGCARRDRHRRWRDDGLGIGGVLHRERLRRAREENAHQIVDAAPMRQLGAFGMAGRAGRIEDARVVIGINRSLGH